MRLFKISFLKLTLAVFVLTSLFSCSKDADLLSDYVITNKTDIQSITLLTDDRFFMARGQNSIVMDVLNNDSFSSNAQVAIVSISAPNYGNVTINEDNTLTYIPQTVTPPAEETATPDTAPEEDTFTYTTEVNTENEVLRQEATVTISTAEMGELLAFPGAEGFGKYTTGGRGGAVIHVTNLNDKGPGSLRAALEKTGTRTVVFDVGGDIFLTGLQLNISTSHGNLTIAGETAPFPGITIRGDNISNVSYGGILNISASNVIIRYISVRENNNNRTDNDAIRLRNDGGMNNLIIDHVSLSNAGDENLSMRGVTDCTIQNSMITDPDNNYNFLFGRDNYNFSFLGNYMSHSESRSVFVGYGLANETSEYINNVIYGYEGGMNLVYGNKVDVLGNIYKSFINNSPDYDSIKWNHNDNNPNASITDGAIYVADNFQINPHQYNLYGSRVLEIVSEGRVISNSLVNLWANSVVEIEERVFGAKLPGNSLHQDIMDQEAIMDYFNNNGSFSSLTVPNKEKSSRAENYDTDRDGMADDWERATFGDLSKTASGDEDGNGYTNLETFLFSLIQ